MLKDFEPPGLVALTLSGAIFGVLTALLTPGTDDIVKYFLSVAFLAVLWALLVALTFSFIRRDRT